LSGKANSGAGLLLASHAAKNVHLPKMQADNGNVREF
jgi:hypothetical protein